MKQNATLPDEYVESLKEFTRTSAQFLAHIVALRTRGWPLRSIAEPLGVSRVTVSNWQEKGSNRVDILQESLQIQVPSVPLDAKGQGVSVKRIPKGIPKKDQKVIQGLVEDAARNTRWSRKDSPERLASIRLDELVDLYVIQRKVPASTFADVAGVTRRAIMQRVERVQST